MTHVASPRLGLCLVLSLAVLSGCCCVQDDPGNNDAAADAALLDVNTEEASVTQDGSVDASDASIFCPEILMRQSQPELLAHGTGKDCGPNCRQVTFADSMHRYDVWGDYVVYTTSITTTNHAYLANVVTGEEWRLETGPWSQPGCTQITIDEGLVAWVYARYPSQGPYLVELIRTFDIESHTYDDLACIEHIDSDMSVIYGLDSTMGTLIFTMSDECSECKDLYSVSLLNGVLTRRTDIGQGIVETRANENRVIWTDLNQPQSDIMLFDLVTEDTTNLSNHPADQFRARIKGDKVVWVDHRNDAGGYLHQRNSDIYYLDLATGVTHDVCTDPALQDEPDIDGDIVVWGDWRNNPIPVPVYSNEFINSDIYMKRISTGEEIQLTDFDGMEYYPRVQGNRVFFLMPDDNNRTSLFMIELGN